MGGAGSRSGSRKQKAGRAGGRGVAPLIGTGDQAVFRDVLQAKVVCYKLA